MVIMYVMLWYFGIFFPVLVYCVKKNLATLELNGNQGRNGQMLWKNVWPTVEASFLPPFLCRERESRPKVVKAN
jgi:hypothetical protein